MENSGRLPPVISPTAPLHHEMAVGWGMILLWSIPALLVALVLRVILTWQAPYGVLLPESGDLLGSVHQWSHVDALDLPARRAFVVRLLYAVPLLLHLPVLIIVPIFQHLLGLSVVLISGALCRIWFRHWQWFILPVTFFFAINPDFLTYERTLTVHSVNLWATMLLALAGSFYCTSPSMPKFGFLCAALILESGSHPGGNLFFLFGLLLMVTAHWNNVVQIAIRCAVLALMAILLHLGLKPSQSGLSLMAGLVHLTPDDLVAEPGLANYVAPIRDELRERETIHPAFAETKERAELEEAVREYIAQRKEEDPSAVSDEEIEAVAWHGALETGVRNVHRIPWLALRKFAYSSSQSPSTDWNDAYLIGKQLLTYHSGAETILPLARRLTGKAASDEDDLEAFVLQAFSPARLHWLAQWQVAWRDALYGLRLPDRKYSEGVVVGGYPAFLIIAGLGLLAALFIPSVIRPFHRAWAVTILVAALVTVIGSAPHARATYALQPFFWLYFLLALDFIARLIPVGGGSDSY